MGAVLIDIKPRPGGRASVGFMMTEELRRKILAIDDDTQPLMQITGPTWSAWEPFDLNQ
jgi:hypothetical protein